MKAELEPTLTNRPQTPYPKGGDISMAENGEKPMGTDETARPIETAAETGEETDKQSSESSAKNTSASNEASTTKGDDNNTKNEKSPGIPGFFP